MLVLKQRAFRHNGGIAHLPIPLLGFEHALTMDRKRKTHPMKRLKTIQEKAEAALKEAIRGVVAQHRKSGRPLAVWKDGKVMMIDPKSVKP